MAESAPDWAPLTVDQQKHQQQLQPAGRTDIAAENAGELPHLEEAAALNSCALSCLVP